MIANCKHCQAPMCISKIALFRNLTLKQQRLIISFVNRKIIKKGEIFLHENDALSSFVIVSQGRFKAYSHSIEGKQNVLYYFSIGEFFGQNALFEKQYLPYTIEALEDSVLCMIDSQTMKQLMIKEPELSLSIVSALTERVSYLEHEITSAAAEKIEVRLLRLLYDLSKDYGKHNKSEIILKLPLNQEEIAMRLGVTRESISRNLKKLVQDKTIRMPSRKEIILPKM